MIGRLDTHKGICSECNGTGRDPKKRKRKCTSCDGDGSEEVCDTCGHIVGKGCTSEGILDNAYCTLKGVTDLTLSEYEGEPEKCLIKYKDMEVRIGYTLMHDLASHIDDRGMTYCKDLGTLKNFFAKVRNAMGHDAELEMKSKEKER